MKSNALPILLVACLFAFVGCSQPVAPENPAGSAGGRATNASATPMAEMTNTAADSDDSTIRHIDCAEMFSPTDLAGLLKGQVAISVYPYRSDTCEFESDSGATVTLYSGNGDTDQIEWDSAAAHPDAGDQNVPGVGDRAFVQKGTLLSKKGDTYCAVSGAKADPTVAGALCNKIYSMR